MVKVAALVIALVNVGGVDDAMFDRVVKHLEATLDTTPLVLAPREAVTEAGLDAEADVLAAMVNDDVIGIVALTMLEKESAIDGKIYPVRKVSFVNVAGLEPADGDAEAFGRRVEKEAVRCSGAVLGMPPCPLFLCALFHYTDDQGLDSKGRNFCPPCQRLYETRAAEVGLTRGTDAPGAPPAGE